MTEYFAFSKIDSALDKTKAILWPFNLGIWLRLALISLFAGGITAINPFQFTGGPSEMGGLNTAMPGMNGFPDMTLILLIVFAVIILALIFGYLSAVFQFIFVDCLRTKEFRIRHYFSERVGKGARLFGFELAVSFLLILLVAVAMIALIAGVMGTAGGAMNIMIFFTMMLAVIIIAIPIAILFMLTIDFVVPIMTADDCGVIEGWKKCWNVMGRGWLQIIIYIIMKFILSIVIVIIMVIIAVIAAIIIGVPFLLAFIATAGLSAGTILSPVSIILLIAYVIILIPVILIISVPFVTYIRMYSLDVLGAMAPEYSMTDVYDEEGPDRPDAVTESVTEDNLDDN
ncbi:DUF7544 domain-containing protein [Methanoplanus endosymbiosus]|uniref:DUF4013 domain-containing protein n=1 Tax=Methanoplanus endosymbiosus TaxID=33865 RepID=A0A9E7PQ07_9EURY|nr:DUF4013 domain-containing protein [Methanoplanus endosymbiosus]UUX92736.1 DUF4013 domain-containing protein [Methanoplanus endosymbiosus]